MGLPRVLNAADLARLRQQAGARARPDRNVTTTLAAPVPAEPAGASLRQVSLPARMRGSRAAADAAAQRHAMPGALPGLPVADGVHLLQRSCPELAPPPSAPLFLPSGSRQPLVLIDTETTGLSGGCGTLAFVLGALRWTGQGWELVQWWLLSPRGEAEMLRRFHDWIGPQSMLLSYNGGSFDLPLLRSRQRLNRLEDRLAVFQHVDLLHWIRRLYRRDWPDCRQATAELQLLGLDRIGDLPGALAPAAWRRWLRLGEVTEVAQVLDHNARDLLRMARLTAVIDAEIRRRLAASEPEPTLVRRLCRDGHLRSLLAASVSWDGKSRARLLRSIRPESDMQQVVGALCADLSPGAARTEFLTWLRRLRPKTVGRQPVPVQAPLPGLAPGPVPSGFNSEADGQ